MSSYTNVLPRIVSSTGLGLVVTVMLFYVMTVLIRGDDTLVIVDEPITTISFLPVLEDEPVIRIPRARPPPVPVVPPTDKVPPIAIDPVGGEGVEWTAPGPEVFRPGPAIGVSDGEAAPLVTSVPEYPPRAVSQGPQGWVIVEFAVDPQGKVFAPRVIEGQPSGIFDSAALRAVARYKYKPREINGEGVAVEGVRQRIVFELTS